MTWEWCSNRSRTAVARIGSPRSSPFIPLLFAFIPSNRRVGDFGIFWQGFFIYCGNLWSVKRGVSLESSSPLYFQTVWIESSAQQRWTRNGWRMLLICRSMVASYIYLRFRIYTIMKSSLITSRNEMICHWSWKHWRKHVITEKWWKPWFIQIKVSSTLPGSIARNSSNQEWLGAIRVKGTA